MQPLKPLRETLYTGKVEHDNISQIHRYIRALFDETTLDTSVYSLPMAVPGKKLLQYVFTLKKMRTQLDF